jgi:RimJ/RimL family protein N-acetyltransferase
MTTFRLQDNTCITIEPVTGREDPREFQRFINTLTKEGTYLLLNKPIGLAQEKKWLDEQASAHKKGEQIYLKALAAGRLIGDCIAKPGFGRNKDNISLAIAIARPWRDRGLGTLMLSHIMMLAEKKWEPRNYYLHVVEANTRAKHVYESLGFQIVARLPQWFEYNGTYLDEFILIHPAGTQR